MTALLVSHALGALLTQPALAGSALSQLQSRGFAVVPDYLPTRAVAALRTDVAALQSQGRFAVAGVGEAATNRQDGEVRRCEQCFVWPKRGGGDADGRDELHGVSTRRAPRTGDLCSIPHSP